MLIPITRFIVEPFDCTNIGTPKNLTYALSSPLLLLHADGKLWWDVDPQVGCYSMRHGLFVAAAALLLVTYYPLCLRFLLVRGQLKKIEFNLTNPLDLSDDDWYATALL